MRYVSYAMKSWLKSLLVGAAATAAGMAHAAGSVRSQAAQYSDVLQFRDIFHTLALREALPSTQQYFLLRLRIG